MRVLIITIITLAPLFAFSKTHTVKMLNVSKDKQMLFEPYWLEVSLNEKVNFIPTDAAHNSQSIIVPKGSLAWKSELNQPITFNFENPGIYLYECFIHTKMGMLGIIIVDDNYENKALVIKKLKEISGQSIMNKERVQTLVKKLEAH